MKIITFCPILLQISYIEKPCKSLYEAIKMEVSLETKSALKNHDNGTGVES